MNLVCSWGGVGTTTLLEFLASIEGYSCNPAHGYINPLKHPLSPPSKATRAVFLYGCPYASLLSLFRRRIDRLHYVNVNGLFPTDIPYPTGNLWSLTCREFGLRQERPGVWVDSHGEYADRCGASDWLEERKNERVRAEKIVLELSKDAYHDLSDFAARGKDVFRRHEQFENWLKGAPYPVLLVRYEALWDNLDSVLDFLQVPRAWRRDFPMQKPRVTDLRGLEAETLESLERLYGDLATRLSSLPDIFQA